MKSLLAAALIVALYSGISFAAAPLAGEPQKDTVIRSAQALTQYLASHAQQASPLDAMPLGARKRFLAQLRFGAAGVGGFGTAELKDTLTHGQIVAVLALFGLEQFASNLQGIATVRAPRQYESDFELRFDAFDSDMEGRSQLGSVHQTDAFRRLLDGRRPLELARALDPYDRALLYRALLRMLEKDAAPGLAAESSQVLDVLRSGGEATPDRVGGLFDALVSLREFDLADQLAREYPESRLSALPRRAFAEGTEAGPNSMLQVSSDGAQLSRRSLDLAHGLRIVVVAGCHFAKDAATAISANPGLDRLFQQQGTWLAPASEQIGEVAEWNRQFPRQPIQIAWREQDWPQLSSWNMPTFYIFRDGILLTQWSGWPADRGLATLLEQLRRAGVKF